MSAGLLLVNFVLLDFFLRIMCKLYCLLTILDPYSRHSFQIKLMSISKEGKVYEVFRETGLKHFNFSMSV